LDWALFNCGDAIEFGEALPDQVDEATGWVDITTLDLVAQQFTVFVAQVNGVTHLELGALTGLLALLTIDASLLLTDG